MARPTRGVERRWLFAVSGALWTGVGLMLLVYAVAWLLPVGFAGELALGALGLLLAVLAAKYLFRGIARKNIARLDEGPARRSVLAFQPWRSYAVMAFMMALGMALRHSTLPKPALAVAYAAIGGALVLAGGLYHRRFVRDTDSDAS